MTTFSPAEHDFYRRAMERRDRPDDPRVVLGVRAVLTGYAERVARQDAGRMVERCRCGMPVYPLKHERTGRVALVETTPQAHGDVLIDLDAGTYRLWRGGLPADYEAHRGRWFVRHGNRCSPSLRRGAELPKCPPEG